MDPTQNEEQSSIPFTIVVGQSFTEAGGRAFDKAARFAGRIPGSRVLVLHTLTEDTDPSGDRAADQLRLFVRERMAALGGCNLQSVGITVSGGRPEREIARFSREVRADLIFIGSRKGAHLRELLAGSVGAHLVRYAPCPVVLVGPIARAGEAVEPEIEPTCPDCVLVRRGSAGRLSWCARHERRSKAHVYSYLREHPFRTHDSAG